MSGESERSNLSDNDSDVIIEPRTNPKVTVSELITFRNSTVQVVTNAHNDTLRKVLIGNAAKWPVEESAGKPLIHWIRESGGSVEILRRFQDVIEGVLKKKNLETMVERRLWSNCLKRLEPLKRRAKTKRRLKM